MIWESKNLATLTKTITKWAKKEIIKVGKERLIKVNMATNFPAIGSEMLLSQYQNERKIFGGND